MRHDRYRLRLIPLFAIIVLLSILASACRDAEQTASAATTASAPEQPIDVPALTVGVADLESTLQISGNLMAQTRVSVMAKYSGTLSRVAVNIGDRVRAGQLVATSDRRDVDAQADAAAAAVNVGKAALESAEATLANATLERDRAQNLFEKGAVPRQRLDAADTILRASTAQRELAKASLAQADAALRRTQEAQRDATITSPIEGVIVERNYDAGSLVGPGDKPIVVVADLRVLKLEAGVSELEAGRLRVGMPARVTVQARPGEVFEGRLAAIAPEVNAANRHFAIEVRTANPGLTLLSGMYGAATIPLSLVAGAVAVPQDAVTLRAGRRIALKIDKDIVTEVPVVEGLSSGNLVQIASGLAAGDVIVADARRDVVAGAKVNAVFNK
ncbi:MAG: efflux RND transporter periplasmic adaptor subunit [Vicinamibacterales bacterium]